MARLAAAAADLVWADGAEAAGEPVIPRRADVEAAFADALRRRDADAALGLAAGLEAMHHRLGTVGLAVEAGEQALALGGGSAAARLGCLLWHVAMLLAELRVADARAALGQARRAQDELRALALAESRDPELVELGLRTLEGQVELCEGDLDGAAATLDGIAEELVARRQWFTAATGAYILGLIAQARGDVAGAIERFRESCDHFVTCEDVCSLDGASASLAEAAALAGREEEAAAASSTPSASRRSGRWASAPPT